VKDYRNTSVVFKAGIIYYYSNIFESSVTRLTVVNYLTRCADECYN